MYTLGHSFAPAPIHAGGLRYHGMAPLICHLNDLGVIEAQAVPQVPVFEAAQLFARTEGIVPAPEPAHAVRVAIDEALRCKEAGESKVIAFNLCGHGHFDLQAYRSFQDGQLVNYEYPQSASPRRWRSHPRSADRGVDTSSGRRDRGGFLNELAPVSASRQSRRGAHLLRTSLEQAHECLIPLRNTCFCDS